MEKKQENKSEKKFDKNQTAAICADLNSVVSAGAGSGKTTVLSERYCRLVIEKKYKPEEILTLTFTKKATTEMSSRIYKVLKGKAPEAAEEFFKANIKTLDSYCSSVAKLGARYYGISPDFVQDKDALDKKAGELALSYIMNNRDNPVIQKLAGIGNYLDISNALFVQSVAYNSTLSHPLDFRSSLKKQIEEICELWKKCEKQYISISSEFLKAVDEFSGNRESKTFIKYHDVADAGIADIPEFDLDFVKKDTSKAVEKYLPLIWDFLKKADRLFSIPKPGRMTGGEIFGEICDSLRELSPSIENVAAYFSTYNDLVTLVPLLEKYQEDLIHFKRTSGVLSFADIADLAVSTLSDYPEIRRVEKSKYKAIMIDEFQDNNSLQRDMLFMLAEKPERMEKGVPSVGELSPDKLFFVGDEKQSIYLFRGADVSVFRSLSSDFKDGNLNMDTNYRSHKALIACFNSIFGNESYPASMDNENPSYEEDLKAAFYTEADERFLSAQGIEIPSYEAVYKHVCIPEDKRKDEKIEEWNAPHLHFAFFDKGDVPSSSEILSGEEAEVDWISKKIQHLVTEGVNGKVYKYSDIAILLKNYSTQNMFERSFLNSGIPYNTETVKGFFSDGPVNDIFSYLRILVYPSDRLSYSHVLRSPFVNLSVDEAEKVLLAGEEFFCLENTALLSAESLSRFEKAKEFFFETKEKAALLEIPEMVSRLWYESGYRYEVMWNHSVEMYEKMFDLIYALAVKARTANETLAAFVDNARVYQDDSSKLEDMDIPMEKVSGVNILSIHKSKGLEYPVVFVVNAHKGEKRDNNSSPVYFDKNYGLSVNFSSSTNYFYNMAKEVSQSKRTAELRRVVYVALTRAVDELFVSGAAFSDKKIAESYEYAPGGEKRATSVLDVLLPFFAFYNSQEYTGVRPFDVEMIEPRKRSYSALGKKRKNVRADKKALVSLLNEEKPYEKARVVVEDEVPLRTVSPSSLHDNWGEEDGSVSETSSVVPYSVINSIVEKSGGSFGYDDFGTLAHFCMETFVKGETFFFPEKYATKLGATEGAVSGGAEAGSSAGNGLSFGSRSLSELNAVLLKMRETFSSSEIGKEVENARDVRFCRAEMPFKSFIGGKIVNGIMDLVFERKDGTYVILDYKTDQVVAPEVYYNQLACYRESLKEMLCIKERSSIKCVLYYLRHAKAVDITSECEKVDVESVVSQACLQIER